MVNHVVRHMGARYIDFWPDSIPGPSLRLKFLPVQENLPEPGFVLKNYLRAENRYSGKCFKLLAKHPTCKSAVLKQCPTFRRDSGVNFCDRARIRVIGWFS